MWPGNRARATQLNVVVHSPMYGRPWQNMLENQAITLCSYSALDLVVLCLINRLLCLEFSQ